MFIIIIIIIIIIAIIGVARSTVTSLSYVGLRKGKGVADCIIIVCGCWFSQWGNKVPSNLGASGYLVGVCYVRYVRSRKLL